MSLFGRNVAVEFQAAGGVVSTRVSDVRVSFRVAHTAERSPSKATIKVYNTSLIPKGIISAPDSEVRLFAGYELLPRMVFRGQPTRGGVSLKTQGPDKILQVDAADGGRSFANTTLSLSYAPGTPATQLINDILIRTGWGRGFIAPIPLVYTTGATLVGRPAKLLDSLVASINADWFVRDNALYVVIRGTSTPETAPLVSSTQGNLIGLPVQTREGVKFRMLLDATMRPGRLVTLQSNNVNGLYVVRDATFVGDSGFSAEFYVDVAARPVGAP